jgi:hypothetical protein
MDYGKISLRKNHSFLEKVKNNDFLLMRMCDSEKHRAAIMAGLARARAVGKRIGRPRGSVSRSIWRRSPPTLPLLPGGTQTRSSQSSSACSPSLPAEQISGSE